MYSNSAKPTNAAFLSRARMCWEASRSGHAIALRWVTSAHSANRPQLLNRFARIESEAQALIDLLCD